MSEETIDQNWLLTEGPQSVLERTLVAEYLISRGYLVSDLDQLPPEVAQSLMREACQFTKLRLADMESNAKFPWEIRFPIFLN